MLKGRAVPALLATGAVMGEYAFTFGVIGTAFAASECLAESFRGKKDAWNGAMGGAAAGAVVGLRAGRLPVGVGAAAALAAVSALVDTSGHKLRATEGGIDDGATPPRIYYPYRVDN